MHFFKKGVLLFGIILLSFSIKAQQAAAVDSIKHGLAGAKTVEEKVFWLDNLARTMMNVNPVEADTYGQQLIMVAEESRDRKLMIKAYQANGIRCGFFRGQKMYATRAIGYYEKALSIARQERMDEQIGSTQILLADVYLSVPDKEKALRFSSEAFTRISTTKNDSLKVEAHIINGKVFEASNEKAKALEYYLEALEIAESMDDSKPNRKRKAESKRNSYLKLSNFYSRIEQYDKAIDKYTDAYKELDNINDRRVPYQRCIDISALGNLHSANKNNEIAITYYERSIAMADSLRFSNLKVPAYVSLLNLYLTMNEPKKALDYMNSSRGKELVDFLYKFGMPGSVYQAYGSIYSKLNEFDSARFYFSKALPLFEQTLSETSTVGVYLEVGDFYKRTGEKDKAIGFFTKAKDIGERNGLLEVLRESAKQMDTLYTQKQDYRTAAMFSAMYYTYKDSIANRDKRTALDQVEAAAVEERKARLLKEEEERKRRRNNIQYIAITIGIVLLFMSLVVLGMFKVSAGLIKAIGFFVFLMLFEFIFLVSKKNIYSITHGEPWKDLLFMIGLAALLVPLHHWMEHKVLHYLTSHNRLTAAGHHIKKKFFTRRTGE